MTEPPVRDDPDALEAAPVATVEASPLSIVCCWRIFHGCMEPRHVAEARFDNFLSVILHALQIIWSRFLTMEWHDRVWLGLCVSVLVGGAMLWPILLSLKLDGKISAPYAVIWIPLWVYNALGVLFFLSLISWGKIKAPPGQDEQDWKDPYPVSLRVMELCKWTLLVLFQVFLVLRLDRDIDWSWLKVMSPLLAWASLRMFGYVYKINIKTSWLGVRRSVEAVSAMLGSCIVLLQLIFVILKLDGEVDWNWWLVFLPVWIVYCVTFCFSLCGNLAFAGISDADDPNVESSIGQTRRNLAMAAVQFQRTSHPLSGVWIVTAILAVAAITGANFSTFVIFIPQFILSGILLTVLLCFICGCRVNIPGIFVMPERDENGF